MKHEILVFESPQDFENRTDPDNSQDYWAAFGANHQALVDAGVMIGSNGLQGPDTAASIQLKDRKRVVHDGPFADTKEQLGGFLLVDVPGISLPEIRAPQEFDRTRFPGRMVEAEVLDSVRGGGSFPCGHA